MSATGTDTEIMLPEWKSERRILTASGVDDKIFYKSEGPIELRIDRFAEFVRGEEERCSAPVYIRGLSWQILAHFKEAAQSNNQDGQPSSKGFSFDLCCPDNFTNRDWECHAKYSLRIMAQKEGVKDISEKDLKDTFNGTESFNAWGLRNFVTCDFLLNSENGYIKDDTVILQAHVKPLTLKAVSGNRYAIENCEQLFSSSTQYSWDFVLIIEDEEVHVQKIYLAMHSEYFKEQFSKYGDKNKAVLQDVGYGEFIELLSVIYPTLYPIKAENVESISKLAFKFKMAALLKQCEIFLMENNAEFGRAKSLLMAEWYGLEHLTRMLFDRIFSSAPVSYPVSDPEIMDITTDRGVEILQELASSVCCPSDGVLIVENRRIPIHKTHLAMYSEYFTAMFQGAFEERNKDEFVLEEVDYNEILELLMVIYPTEQHFSITEKNVGVILKMADRFIMPAILGRCKKLLQNSTGIRAARKLWLAQRYNLPDLQAEYAKKYKTMSDVEELRAEPEFGLFDDKTRTLVLDSLIS
ncbi:BTB/POZ domain-containing protein [Ditylenchus destructor]|uniref:BTB/POZ domain-containing protein n=1 Tax=Ditylenchus destructor TaxID=166010 RepID=A0AAD4MXM7_9BILA|nr:BTB/POZ domain-containing protein [Ditylenchus destructor]